MITAEETIKVFKEYLEQQVWIRNIYVGADEPEHRFGRLAGIQSRAVLVILQDGKGFWFNLMNENACYEFKLLLKPCSRLTSEITEQAKGLPASGFIAPYYRSLGFDMPVFLSPSHPANCRYAKEVAYSLTKKGELFFAALDINIGDLKKQRRTLSEPCLDWSERRHHLAGSLGTALLDKMLSLDYIRRTKNSRAIVINSKGQLHLYEVFNASA